MGSRGTKEAESCCGSCGGQWDNVNILHAMLLKCWASSTCKLRSPFFCKGLQTLLSILSVQQFVIHFSLEI